MCHLPEPQFLHLWVAHSSHALPRAAAGTLREGQASCAGGRAAGQPASSIPSVCNDENPCEGMSRHATFENFGMAFLTLFQVSTGDNWNGIMKVLVGGLGREDSVRMLVTVLPVRAPRPSACPVSRCSQEGRAGPREEEGPAWDLGAQRGADEAGRGSLPTPKCWAVLRSVLRCYGTQLHPARRGLGARSPGQGLQSLLLVPSVCCPAYHPAEARRLPPTLGLGWVGSSSHRGQARPVPPALGPYHPPPRAQDTLRDCTHDERSCLSSLQFVSPLYFVSFVLTAQFVLINVVVAVLMKHLDDSNKEAQEDAEMDAELELEMAQGLGPSPRPPAGSPGAPGRGPGGAGGGGDVEGHLCRRCYSPAQVGRGLGVGGTRLPRVGCWGCQSSWPGWPLAETSVFWGLTLLSSVKG